MMTNLDLVVQDEALLREISGAYESAAVKTILPPVSPRSIVSKP